MPDYADSSFLVSRFLADANTRAAREYLQSTGVVFALTRFHLLEINNAFQLALFRKWATKEAIESAITLMEDDLNNHRLTKTGLSYSRVFRLATELSEKHSSTTGARSLDLLHVAAAQTLQADSFASFDARQRALATLVGLQVVP